MKKIKSNVVFGVCTALIALAAMLYTRTFPEILAPGVPSAAFFPLLTGVGIVICSLVVIIQGFRDNGNYFHFSEDKKDYLVLVATIVVTIVYIAAIGKLHFILITTAYIIALGRLYGMKWKALLPCSVIGAAVLFGVFNGLLNVMLNG